MTRTSFRERLLIELHDRVDGLKRQITSESQRPGYSPLFIVECLLEIEETQEIIHELQGTEYPIHIKAVKFNAPEQKAN